jgi:hypothetical protein
VVATGTTGSSCNPNPIWSVLIYNGSVFEMTLDQAVGIRDALTLITDDIKKEIEDNDD